MSVDFAKKDPNNGWTIIIVRVTYCEERVDEE